MKVELVYKINFFIITTNKPVRLVKLKEIVTMTHDDMTRDESKLANKHIE